MFFEKQNSFNSTHIKIEEGQDFNFPIHLHGNFELITVVEGEMQITVDEREYTLTPDSFILVFPEQVHSFKTVEKSRHKLWIFPTTAVQAYSSALVGYLPENNLFTLSEGLKNFLFDLKEGDSILKIKGVLYLAFAEFEKQIKLIKKEYANNELLINIFDYVRENFSGDCSLKDLSESLNFNYVYLSKYFKEKTGVPFTEYVNRFRISEICYRLTASKDSALKIAFDCGFSSIRSFNRSFKTLMNMTPTEYRNKIKV